MKRKIAALICFLFLAQAGLTVMAAEEPAKALETEAAEVTAQEDDAGIVSAYCMDNTLYSFVRAEGLAAEKLQAQTEIIGGDTVRPVAMEKSGAAVRYVLLVDNSATMKKYASGLHDYAEALIGEQTQDADYLVVSFGEQVLLNEAAGTEGCLDKASVKNAVLTAIDNLSFKEKWTDPYTGIVSVLDYLDKEYPGEPGDLVNLILLTDGLPDLKDKSLEADTAAAAEDRISASPEAVLHTVSFQKWNEAHVRPQGTGTSIDVSAEKDAAAAAKELADFVNSLMRIDFAVNSSKYQAAGRFAFNAYLRDLSDESAESVRLMPIAAQNIPVMGKSDRGWSAPDAKPSAEKKPEEKIPEPHDFEEKKLEPGADTDSAEPAGKESGDASRRSMLIGAAVAAGVILVLAVIVFVIVKAAKGGKKQKEAEPQGNAVYMRLEVVAGRYGSKKEEYYLRDELRVGRGPDCDIVWADKTVSQLHARIFVNTDGMIYIEDLNSQSGTLVGGMRIYSPNRLRSGDEITVGSACFKLRF